MDPIEQLFQINYPAVFLSVFIILIGVKAVISLIEWFFSKFGIKTKKMRDKEEQKELLAQTVKNLSELQKKHNEDSERFIQQDNEIKTELKKISTMFIDKQIDDMRWEIINFAGQIANDKQSVTKDGYQHCFRTYEKYESIIQEYGLTNGEVELSMEIVNQSYLEKLKNGEF